MDEHVLHASLACLQALNCCRIVLAQTLLVVGQGPPVQALGEVQGQGVRVHGGTAQQRAAAAAPAGTPPLRKRTQDAAEQQHDEAETQGRRHKKKRKKRRDSDAQQQFEQQAAPASAGGPADAESHGQQEQQQQQQEQQAEPAPTPVPDLYKFWTEEQAARLVQCVEDGEYRRQHLGAEALDWAAVAAHFKRSVQAVRSKYRHEKIYEGQGLARGQHERQRQAIGYGWMAMWALSTLPNQEGTGDEVCRAVAAHPPFAALLDRTVRVDSLGVEKWRQRIREELSHRSWFEHTGTKRAGQAVWRLSTSQFDDMPAGHRVKLKDLKLPGLPFLGKHGD